ncbi:MAG: HIT family protein [Candidatus Saccharimonadales bacterium]
MSSIFTKIIQREIPAHIVYEDEMTLAFLDIRPVSEGHLLVVPKLEVDELQDLEPDMYQAVMTTVHKMARLLKEKLNPKRVGLVVYGFDVPHAHVHLIPMEGPGKIQLQHTEKVTEAELISTHQVLTS